jgi:iron complex outermembrane recepter protein
VQVTPQNVGTTGLPIGSVTCAANLNTALLAKTNPLAAANAFVPGAAAGCQPLDIFGIGVASQAAIGYVTGQSIGGRESQTMSLFENVAAGHIEGELPIGTAAGPVAMAVGLVYRNESGINFNCGINCTDVNFNVGNFASFGPAGYNIKEASAEFNAPLLKDQVVRNLSVDAAYRVSDYSTSGEVQTYKFGVVSQVVDAVRLRASYSYDIRAPNLSELFAEPLPVLTDITNPRTGLSTSFYSLTEGNLKLLPEIGETRSLGFVLTPVQGLTTSLDWYYILIKHAINEGLSASTEIAQCAAGVSSFCELITWGHYPGAGGCVGPTLDSCASTILAAVATPPVNSDRETTSGLDFNADYRFPLGAGALDFNSVMNYMFSQHYQSIGVNCDAAGGLSFDEYFYCPIDGVPKFRGTVAAVYTTGPWLATLQNRMIGAAHLVENWQSGVQVDDNDVPFIDYWDVRLSFRFDVGVTLYGAVDNITNKTMPTIPATPVSITDFDSPYRDDIYDGFGRVWRLGLRAKF